jgi:hypothetical protein
MQKYKPEMIQSGLEEIVNAFGGVPAEGKVKFWTELAAKLSRIVGKEEPWDWRYPKQVYDGTNKPSELFAAAVMALGAALDEVPTVVTYTVQVRVFARPGTVDDGSIVLGASKPCSRPGCPVRIVPNVPWREYCSDECRKLDTKRRRKENNEKRS